MRKTALLLFAFLGVSLFAQKFPSKWEVVNLVDDFDEETGEKRVVCLTKGTFTDADTLDGNIDVSVYVDGPAALSVIVYKKGTHRINLKDAVFTYRTAAAKIERTPLISGIIEPEDEPRSFLYLLKQGGIIMVSAYQNNESFRFDIDAGQFMELFADAFKNTNASIMLKYETLDMLGKKIEAAFIFAYVWTPENENSLKTGGEIQDLINTFFGDKDTDNRPDLENWGETLFEQIRLLYPDYDIELLSFRLYP